MIKLKTYLVFISFLLSIVFIGCKKDQNPELESPCILYSIISSDTNYIPHKKNNYWDYCYEVNHAVGNNSKVIFDSIVNNSIQFKIKNTKSSKNGTQISYLFYSIDAQNNLYYTESQYDSISFVQTNAIKLIDPFANNGDTIYKNQIARIK